ncbi:Hypothetical protein CINCED_3A025023 [Cinara cedri]|uniref:Uncharacterized protein n=1 Tax=Cinara cedri TaxID=506608 RepID=A0A5E4NLK0_9HEMI|nr:Hypothetical protein CINCED_3A025023 [Cinara cedri]
MSLALHFIHYFISISYVITIIIHQLHLPASYGNEVQGYTVKTLSQVLTPAECETYLNTGILPPSLTYSFEHRAYIHTGNNVRVNNDLERQMRKRRTGNYKIVPRWKYLLGKFVPDLNLGGLLQKVQGTAPLLALMGMGGLGGAGNMDGTDDEDEKESENDNGENKNKLNNLAKKALGSVPNLGNIGSSLGKSKGNGDAGDTGNDAADNGGGRLNKLNDMAKKAYDRVPNVSNIASALGKGNGEGGGGDNAGSGGGPLNKLNDMAKNAYNSVPNVGSLLGKSNDGKSPYSNVKDALEKSEVAKNVENYILSLIPGGGAAEKALEAKDKLHNAVKKFPKFKKKQD